LLRGLIGETKSAIFQEAGCTFYSDYNTKLICFIEEVWRKTGGKLEGEQELG